MVRIGGVHYAPHVYVDELRAGGVQINMACKGNPYEHAAAESFLKNLKST